MVFKQFFMEFSADLKKKKTNWNFPIKMQEKFYKMDTIFAKH